MYRFSALAIGDVQQLLRIAVDRAAVVDFEFDAEMPQAFAVEHQVGRVAVLVDDLAVLIPAGCAVGVVVIVPIGAVTVNNAAAVLAANVILIKAMLAERVGVVLDGIFLVNTLGTVVADYGQAVGAVLAEPVAFHLEHIFDRVRKRRSLHRFSFLSLVDSSISLLVLILRQLSSIVAVRLVVDDEHLRIHRVCRTEHPAHSGTAAAPASWTMC